MWRRKQKQQQVQKQRITQNDSPHRQLVRRQVVVGVLLCIAIGLLLTIIGYVTRLSIFQIKDVSVVGGFTIPHETIKHVAETELRGTYLKLIPKRFGPLYPARGISEKIGAVSRVKNVELTRDDDNNLIIAFEEYRPQALWCPSIEATECFFIDQTGLAFAPAPTLSGAAFVRYVADEPPAQGHYMAERMLLDDSVQFTTLLENELSLFVTHIEAFGDYDIEYYVSGGGRIKVSQDIPMLDSFNNLKTILSSEDFAHLEPGSFNYVDLRFGDKVFVSEEAVPTLDAASSSASSTE